MQDIVPMCSFDSQKSTKGASKVRRDLINGEIANLRDLLPLPATTRQRLSQLQLMALVCVYVRKSNYFQQVFKHNDDHGSITSIGFSKALSGFLMMMTQNGKLLYISDNAAEYLGHSMEDLLIHGDSVYDIIDKADHQAIQTELLRSTNLSGDDTRIFLCRMNVSRNARRQMRFGDQKVVLVKGHYVSYLPLCSRNEPVFLGTCTPIAMPETRECVVQGATNVFTSIHTMDMKFIHLDKNGEFYLGYTKSLIHGMSWYQLLHWDCMREAQSKHRLIAQSEQDRSCILLLRLQCHSGSFIWVHCVLQVKDNIDSSQQPVIVCTNQVLTEREAAVMRTNSWLYHYYTVQSKLQYGLAYENNTVSRMSSYYPQMMAYPSAHPTTHLPHSETSPYSSFLHSSSITAINGSQLSTASSPSSHYPYSSHPVSYHQLSMESSPFRAGFVPDNPNSHTPPYTNQSYLTSSIPTEECSIPLPSALTSGYTSLSYDKGDTHMKDTSETQPKHSCLKTSDYQSANHDVESGDSHSPKGVDLVDSPRLKRPLCDIDPSATYLSNPFKRRSTFIRSHSNNFLEAFSVTDSSLLPSGSALVSENGSAAALASVPSVRRHFPFSQKLMQLGQRTQELEEISTSHVDTLQKVPDMHSPDISPPHSLYTPTPENSPSFFCYPPNHSLGYRSYAEYDESTKRLSDPYSKIEPLFKLCPSALIKTEAVSPESPVDRSRYKWKNPWSDLELKPVSSEQLSAVKEEDGGGPGRLLDLDSIPRSCRVSRQTPNEPVQSAFRSPSYHLETKGNSQDSG